MFLSLILFHIIFAPASQQQTITRETERNLLITSTTPSFSTTLGTTVTTTEATTKRSLEEDIDPKPITLTVVPNVTVVERNTDLKCIASGTNLPKIKPYELVWFEQGEGGYNNVIKKKYNSTNVILYHALAKHGGQSVFCALIGYYSPKQSWMMHTKYIDIKKYEPLHGEQREHNGSSKLMIGSVTGVACLLLLIILSVFMYKRLRKKNIKPPPSPEESIDEKAKSSSEAHAENIYGPLPKVPFYEAREMVAANMKFRKDLVKPKRTQPPLPARSQFNQQSSISEDEDYVYTYAYNVRPQ